MPILFVFFGALTMVFQPGCAAPITETVAKGPSRKIDQELFKEGNEVWITYIDNDGIPKKRRGTVLHTDGDSVRVRPGKWRKAPVAIGYSQIEMVSRPLKHTWFMGVSTGRFWAPAEFLGDSHPDPFSTLIGFSPRFYPFSNHALEADFLIGTGTGEFSKWLGTTISSHWYTKIPRTYFFLGTGLIWSIPTEEQDAILTRGDLKHQSPIKIFRWGFGGSYPILRGLDVRLEAETGISSYGGAWEGSGSEPILGFRVHLEGCLRRCF